MGNEKTVAKDDLRPGDFVRLSYAGGTRHTDCIILDVTEKGIRGKAVQKQRDGSWGFVPGDVLSGIGANGVSVSAHVPQAVPGIAKLDADAKAGRATADEKLALHNEMNAFMKGPGKAAIEQGQTTAQEVAAAPERAKPHGKEATRDEKRDFREELTRSMADLMDKGEIPWYKPWSAGDRAPVGPAQNPVTGTRYSGGNRLALTMAALDKGYTSNEWATFKQAQAQGWQVRKGEKATLIERWQESPFYQRKGLGLDIRAQGKPVTIVSESHGTVQTKDGKELSKGDITVKDKDGKTMDFAEADRLYSTVFAKIYPVFNLDQMDGVPQREPKAPATTKEMHARMQSLVKGMQADGLRLETGGDRAFYSPAQDRIQMPKPDAFKDLPHYYSTLLHEMGHSTGAASRLNREGISGPNGGFGSPVYAKEELVAELASFFAAAETGIPRQPDDQHAAYLQSWSKALREDKNALFHAAKEAGKAVDYMLEKEKVLELAQDKVIASPNLHHGVTDGPVLAVDERTDTLVQQSGRLAVAHKRGVAPDAKPGDELRVSYNRGHGKSQDLGPIRERQREHAKSQEKDGGRGLSIGGR